MAVLDRFNCITYAHNPPINAHADVSSRARGPVFIYTLVNVYVDLLLFTRIAGTSQAGCDRYWCKYYIEKHAIYHKDNRLQPLLSIQYVHGDLCKHLGIDSSTDHPDRYSNLFLNAYINRHVHAEYLK